MNPGANETAFDRLRRYPDGFKLKLTMAGNYPQYPVEGRICHQADKAKVVVFVGSTTWLELTEQSDMEFYGEHHLHVH